MQVIRFVSPQKSLVEGKNKRQAGEISDKRGAPWWPVVETHNCTAEGAGSIPGQRSSAGHMVWPKKKEKEKGHLETHLREHCRIKEDSKVRSSEHILPEGVTGSA